MESAFSFRLLPTTHLRILHSSSPINSDYRLQEGFLKRILYAMKPDEEYSSFEFECLETTWDRKSSKSVVLEDDFLGVLWLLTTSDYVENLQLHSTMSLMSVPSFSSISVSNLTHRRPNQIICSAGASVAERKAVNATEPLLLNAVRGEDVERPPSYQAICQKHPSFRERSENVDLVVEISLQPWKVFQPDGVILFSDILTPLPGMNIPFDIVKGKGPIIFDPVSTAGDVDKVREFTPQEWVPYVGEALTILRKEVNNEAAVLGFVGAPFTLASYVVEGGSSKHFSKIKRLAFSQPKVLHALLQKFTTSMAKYIQYQADNGAQAVQIFDSWATELSPADFEEFSLPYLKQIVDTVKQTHPNLPLILYASGSGGLLERLPLTGVDVVSLDWTVDMAEGRKRLGSDIAVQGNVDPGVLFGSKEFITKRINDTVEKAGKGKHILNLGHGIVVGTPEENVAHFFEVAKGLRY
ncbi:Uroporphyrinogen decarboxylase HemE [Cynara cardunculus var. scolymus]|uniref:uroporphyrinogen decarboxylase n=1 Tax=Cynara cardunculus var. scolymus TaxID=59895 RepID=A0A124SHM7_CYNCS|nr:Uroporphyrinogen decarboxylase HemE [Cynara cardunculus var. scolymus]